MRVRFKAVVLLLALSFLAVPMVQAQVVGEGLLAAGPTAKGPLGLFPAWYMDKAGVGLEMCQQGPPLCLAAPTDLANPAVGEAFYWHVFADIGPGGANGFVLLGLEAAFLNPGVLTPANAMVFSRLRARLDALPAAGDYTVTHPFGTAVFPAEPDPQNPGLFRVNQTVDLPGSSGPASFSQVLAVTNMGPWLRATAAPAGFLGDNVTPSTVTGGPNGNSVTIVGPGFSATTDLWLVQGKLATNGGLSGVKATYSRPAVGPGTITVNASSIGGQRIVAFIGTSPKRTLLTPVDLQIGNYSATMSFPGPGPLQPLTVRNTTDASKPSVVLPKVRDVVTISRASFVGGRLIVNATTSDLRSPRPTLRLLDPAGTVLATRVGTLNVSIPSPINPARIRVISSAGGAAAANVALQ